MTLSPASVRKDHAGIMQCKDIPDLPILRFLSEHGRCVRYAGYPKSVTNAMPDEIPERLALAKMATLIRRGLVDGCVCGCRGDFEITRKGADFAGLEW